MASLRGIHHVSIEVGDLDAAREFYTDRLGLKLVDRPDLGAPGVWLTVDGTTQLHIVVVDGFEASARGNHFAFEVGDVDAWVDQLRAAGVDAGDVFDVGAGRQSFVRDPAGNLVELNQPG
jgi:catechol 2,3-dioxygenase-like lactoylglutathione lyase family enzyme